MAIRITISLVLSLSINFYRVSNYLYTLINIVCTQCGLSVYTQLSF